MSTIDTAGVVRVPLEGVACFHERTTWTDLDAFTQGYVEALFASGVTDEWIDEDDGRQRRIIIYPAAFAFSDVAPEALAAILQDCARISEMIGGALTSEDGRRIWEHRQAGFPGPGHLDGELGAAFPPLAPYLGDDGKVRLKPAHSKTQPRGPIVSEQTEIDQLRAANWRMARLGRAMEAERDRFIQLYETADARAEAAEALLQEAAKVLEPFAKAADHYRHVHDEHPVFARSPFAGKDDWRPEATAGDLRRAAAFKIKAGIQS